MARRSQSLSDVTPPPMGIPPQLSLVNGGTNDEQPPQTAVSFEDGAMKIEHPDGSVVVDFDPKPESAAAEKGFYANLVPKISEDDLADIASDLLEGIERDEQSRKEWLSTRSLGITLLGAKLEQPRTDTAFSGAPLEGMSTVRHPLLMEASVSFQATARAELLPAAGPVKVRNDAPPPPVAGKQIEQDLADSLAEKDLLGQALEKDMNHYLTYTATEYVPDTDRMLFYVGFGGDGFKKVYNCPLRRRPVSESIDAEDLIASNHATDLQNCPRVTHRVKMRRSTLRRLQIMGFYVDVELGDEQSAREQTEVDKKKEEIEGVSGNLTRPKDREYVVFESYCELDLDQFAPRKLKGKGLPLPYIVTIHKESRKILRISRNWEEKDEQATARKYFVQFPFIRGLGFYGFGFIHLIGNATNALTAAWREMLDAGMFNCFPGFIYAKGVGRQNTNEFRVPPGGGIGLDVGLNQRLQDTVMPLPYKEPGASHVQFIQHVEDTARRLASTGNMQVGEGKQDAPVGTTLALIEQASKVMDSAHKRLHAAQAEEFKLLKERFKEDPEAFWRHNKTPARPWEKEQFLQALSNCELVPVADPNNPTMMHRIAKALAIKQLQQANPAIYDAQAVDMRIMRTIDVDPTGLFAAQPAQPPPDPRMIAIQQKAQAEQQKNQIAQLEQQIKAAELQATMQDNEKDRASRERIEQMKIQLELLRVRQEEQANQQEMQNSTAESQNDIQNEAASNQQEMRLRAMESMLGMQHDRAKALNDLHMENRSRLHEMQRDAAEHQMKMEQARRDHDHKVSMALQNHQLKLQQQQAQHEQKMSHIAEESKKTQERAMGGRVTTEQFVRAQQAMESRFAKEREAHNEAVRQMLMEQRSSDERLWQAHREQMATLNKEQEERDRKFMAVMESTRPPDLSPTLNKLAEAQSEHSVAVSRLLAQVQESGASSNAAMANLLAKIQDGSASQEVAAEVRRLIALQGAPRTVVRDKDGRMIGVKLAEPAKPSKVKENPDGSATIETD